MIMTVETILWYTHIMDRPTRRRGRRLVVTMKEGKLVRKESEKDQIEQIATDLFFKVMLKDFLGDPPRIQITGQYSFTVPRTAYEDTPPPPRKLAIAGILARLYNVDADRWEKIQYGSPNESERELFKHFAFVIKQSKKRIPAWIDKNIRDLFVEPSLYMDSFRGSDVYKFLSRQLKRKAEESKVMVFQTDMVVHDRDEVKARISRMWGYIVLEEMFKPSRSNLLGIDVYSMRNRYDKTISAYDFFRTLFYHDLVQLESPFRDVRVLGLTGERVLPIGSVVHTKKGNAFRVGRELGGGANANVYKAKTIESVSGIPSKVALKVGAKELLHEVAVYKSVEALRLEEDEEDPAIPRYYDYVYIAGIVVIVLEKINGSSSTRYGELNQDQKSVIDRAESFANYASGITLQDVLGPGNVMVGRRTDLRYREHGVYLIDLDPFGQAG